MTDRPHPAPKILAFVLVLLFLPRTARAGPPDGITLTIHRGTRAAAPVQPGSAGNGVIGPAQWVEQSFVAEATGRLIGIEIAPLRDTAEPGDTMELELFDETGGRVLGVVSLDAGTFPPGAGSLPAGIFTYSDGPGYFDLSPLNVNVTAGRQLSFKLRAGYPAGVCDLASFECIEGRVGNSCSSALDCNKDMRVGTNSDTSYPQGIALFNGWFLPPGHDLAFKVVTLVPPDDAVSLTWTPRGQSYDVFRSQSPQAILDPASLLDVAAFGASYVDAPPPTALWCYQVSTRPLVDAACVDSWSTIEVGPGEAPGQTFEIGVAGILSGIEIAPLGDGSSAGETLVLDLLDGAGAVLGSAELPTSAFGTGALPDPLSYSTLGPGYFDLSSLDVAVSPGQALAFRLRPSWGAGVCNPTTHLCSAGRVGEFCLSHAMCGRYLEVGLAGNCYPAGTATRNGAALANEDLAFKVVVLP
jgi:hypothetical protein